MHKLPAGVLLHAVLEGGGGAAEVVEADAVEAVVARDVFLEGAVED